MKEMLLGLLLGAVIVMAMFVWAAFRNADEVDRRLRAVESNVIYLFEYKANK